MDEIPVVNGLVRWDRHSFCVDYPDLSVDDFLVYALLCKKIKHLSFNINALAAVELKAPSSTKWGYLRLIPREGASSIHSSTQGDLPMDVDPLGFEFTQDKEAIIEYYACEIESEISAHGAARTPSPRFEIEMPESITSCIGKDGAVWLGKDGVTFRWGSNSHQLKRSYGFVWHVPFRALESAIWVPGAHTADSRGFIQLYLAGTPTHLKAIDPAIDVNAILIDSLEGHVDSLLLTTIIRQRIARTQVRPDNDLLDRWTALYNKEEMNLRPDDPIAAIRRLSELHHAGVLTDEEFEAKKRDLLGRI